MDMGQGMRPYNFVVNKNDVCQQSKINKKGPR